jgi:hypothetical protein
MPEFFALQCASCGTFCVQQATKAGKWQCRLCGAKQSIVRIFARSASAADVRGAVGELNMRRGLAAEQRLRQRMEGGSDGGGASGVGGVDEEQGDGSATDTSFTSAAVSSAWDEFAAAQRPSRGASGAGGAGDEEDDRFVMALPERPRKRTRVADNGGSEARVGQGGDERGQRGGSSASAGAAAPPRLSGSRGLASPPPTLAPPPARQWRAEPKSSPPLLLGAAGPLQQRPDSATSGGAGGTAAAAAPRAKAAAAPVPGQSTLWSEFMGGGAGDGAGDEYELG